MTEAVWSGCKLVCDLAGACCSCQILHVSNCRTRSPIRTSVAIDSLLPFNFLLRWPGDLRSPSCSELRKDYQCCANCKFRPSWLACRAKLDAGPICKGSCLIQSHETSSSRKQMHDCVWDSSAADQQFLCQRLTANTVWTLSHTCWCCC